MEGCRILLIEDSLDTAESMQALLRLSGNEVEFALDGTAGIERAREFGPDVVFCDLGLPGEIDGFGVARALKGDGRSKSAWLIALSGFGRPSDQKRALEAGFDLYLTKPANRADLERAMNARLV